MYGAVRVCVWVRAGVTVQVRVSVGLQVRAGGGVGVGVGVIVAGLRMAVGVKVRVSGPLTGQAVLVIEKRGGLVKAVLGRQGCRATSHGVGGGRGCWKR